jgi:CBS-domain-containing membrane protein
VPRRCATGQVRAVSTGHHHVPVLDDEQRVVGSITPSDVVRASVQLK